MNPKSHKASSGSPAGPAGDRLADLLTSFSNLQSSNRALLQNLRGSIHELRELKSQLKQQQYTGFSGGTPETGREASLSQRYGLTRREVQVAQLLAQGHSNETIAHKLKISAHTARHHTQRILSKLEVHSRGEAGAKIRG